MGRLPFRKIRHLDDRLTNLERNIASVSLVLSELILVVLVENCDHCNIEVKLYRKGG